MRNAISLRLAGALVALVLNACGSSVGERYRAPMQEDTHRLDYPEAAGGDAPYRFLVVGDTQNPKPDKRQNDEEREAVYRSFAAALAESTMVVHLGDLVKTGGNDEEWTRYFDSIFWDRLSSDQRRLFFPIPGNHEYKTRLFAYGGGDLRQFYERFPHIGRQRFYFFVRGDAAFIFLDSGRNGIAKLLGGERWQNGVEEQVEWLERVVFPELTRRADEGLKRIFLFFHKPGYVTPVYIKNRASVRMLKRFDDFNYRQDYRLQLFSFSGHIHTFSHIVRDYNGDGEGEIDQFTVGTGGGTQRGGKYFRKVRRVEDLDRYRLEKYRERRGEGFDRELFEQLRLDNTHFGYLEVVVGERVEFVYHRYRQETDDFYVDYTFAR